jgi:hypothetical protein
MAYMNRAVIQRSSANGRAQHAKPQPERTTVAPVLQHPHRALPPGHQYLPHDKPGGKAAQRRLRQMRAQELKRLKKEYGSTAVQGREDGGLLLDFAEPVRVVMHPAENVLGTQE